MGLPQQQERARRVVALLIAAFILTSCLSGPVKTQIKPEQRLLNLQSFDTIWATIRDKHWDPTLGGLDWDAIRQELRPRVETASTMAEARAAMREMLSRLNLSHFGIIPAEVYQTIERGSSEGGPDGVTGLDCRVIEGQAVVVSVAEDSPAARAGVHPGWTLLRVNDREVEPSLTSLTRELEANPYLPLILSQTVNEELRGRIGQTTSLRFLTGRNERIDLSLTLAEPRGNLWQFGNLPPVYVWSETRMIGEDIGYIAFSNFVDPVHVMPVFNRAMEKFHTAAGIIIDLRGNTGGMGEMAVGMAGWFFDQGDYDFGTLRTRDAKVRLIVRPRAQPYLGPVVVLVDELSISASEFFAGGMKDLGRAWIVGRHTIGAALPSVIEKLPNGDGFQYAFGNFISKTGQVVEGVGVMPDSDVSPTREALLKGRDLVIESAVEWIRKQN